MTLAPLNKKNALELSLLLVALFFFAWFSEEVLEGRMAGFDTQVRDLIHAHSSPPATAVMSAITMIGAPFVLWPLAAIISILFWRANWRREAWLFAVAMLGALSLNFALKLGFQRPRPPPFFGLALPHSYSYPSGHALSSVCLCGSLAWLLARHVEHIWARTIIWLAAALLPVLIGFSRIYLGVHYPSDVIAGYGAALIWIAGLSAVSRFSQNRVHHPNSR